MLLDRLVNRKKKGFTLVELMVVVVIIGVLVAIAIPIFSGIQERARQNAHDANIRTLQGAGAMYVSEHGFEADSWDSAEGMEFMDTWPEDPWGNDDTYTLAITASTTTNGTVTPGTITVTFSGD